MSKVPDDLAQRDQLVEAWRSFLRYITRTAPDEGLATASINILVLGRTPVAWKVTWEELPGRAPVGKRPAEKMWESYVRHILAMAKDNGGYAVVNSTVVTSDKRPSTWMEATVRRIYPMEAIEILGEEIILRILFPTWARRIDTKS